MFYTKCISRRCKSFKKYNQSFFYSKVVSADPQPSDEYSEVPQYPPIEPTHKKYLELKEERTWHEKIKRQKTVEEKLLEINVPRYYGWKCMVLKEGQIPYNALDFTKFITRTHCIETNELPQHTSDSSFLVESVLPHLENLILSNSERARFQNSEHFEQEKESTKWFIYDLNRLILKSIRNDDYNVLPRQIDYSPRIESYWHMGSLRETYEKENFKYGIPADEVPEEYLDRPTDKYIQYIGNPLLQVRIENPLPPIIDPREALYFEYPVPIYEYDPILTFGCEMQRRFVTSIPGFWPGESRQFSHLSYHDINHVKYRPELYGAEDEKETLTCQAILASYAWLSSLSTYQGFTTFHDITYPFVTQTVLTDGRNFAFAVYQLNTTELFHKDPFLNPKCNICWMTPKVPLYDSIEDGKVNGVNPNVLKMLFQFYLNRPGANTALKPYLDESIGVVSNYKKEEKRIWLENTFKYISSNRPRHRTDKMYEVADYERIYKIQFYQLVRHPRKRPFERRENPYLRKLSDHAPPYIPKALRKGSFSAKFKATFYPQ